MKTVVINRSWRATELTKIIPDDWWKIWRTLLTRHFDTSSREGTLHPHGPHQLLWQHSVTTAHHPMNTSVSEYAVLKGMYPWSYKSPRIFTSINISKLRSWKKSHGVDLVLWCRSWEYITEDDHNKKKRKKEKRQLISQSNVLDNQIVQLKENIRQLMRHSQTGHTLQDVK